MRRSLAPLVTALAVACGGPTEPEGTATSAGGAGGNAGAAGSSAGASGNGGSTAAGSGGSSGSATAGSANAGSATAGSAGSTTAGSAGSATAGSATAGSATAGSAGSTTAGAAGSGTAGSTTAGTAGSTTAGAAGSTTAGSGGSSSGGVTFTELAPTADFTNIQATGIDGTGQYVIAYCNTPQGSRGCMWDGTTWKALGNKGWFPHSVSLGGGVAVGDKYYWSEPTDLVTIGDALNINGVSDDGNWIAGMHASGGTMAFRWSMATDMEDLGDLAGGGVQSEANAISADGSTACGYSVATAGSFAFIWTKAGGMISMGDLLGGSNQSYCLAMNPTGDVAVGWSSSGKGDEGFRWTKGGGMMALGLPTGGGIWKNSRPSALSADGNVIVGYADTGFGDEAAAIWTPSGKMQLLDAYLTGLGVDLTGWQMKRAAGVSHDGKTIVGWGFTGAGQRSFIVKLP